MKWGDVILKIAERNPDIAVPDLSPAEPSPAVAVAVRHHRDAASEHEEQVAVIDWAAAVSGQYPDLALLFAIPNGGQRNAAVAAKLKAEGVKAGVPDLCLPVSRGGYHSLWIEMKRADRSNHATNEQKEWLFALRTRGHRCHICYGAAEAIEVIEDYLNMEATR